MRVIREGHQYELKYFDHPEQAGQTLHFIEKFQVEKHPTDSSLDGKFITSYDGTTNEEVLLMLIDRMQHLNKKAPCRENSIAITKLQEALFWLNHRTELRKMQGVEGTPFNHESK